MYLLSEVIFYLMTFTLLQDYSYIQQEPSTNVERDIQPKYVYTFWSNMQNIQIQDIAVSYQYFLRICHFKNNIMEDKVFFLYDENSLQYIVLCFCFNISISFICEPNVDLVLFKYLMFNEKFRIKKYHVLINIWIHKF